MDFVTIYGVAFLTFLSILSIPITLPQVNMYSSIIVLGEIIALLVGTTALIKFIKSFREGTIKQVKDDNQRTIDEISQLADIKLHSVHKCLEHLERKVDSQHKDIKETVHEIKSNLSEFHDKIDTMKQNVDSHIGWSKAKTEQYDKFMKTFDTGPERMYFE